MSKPMYCIKCTEAVETVSLALNLKGWPNVKNRDNSLEWDIRMFAVCVNEVCPRYALMSTLIDPNRKKR